MLVAFNRVFMQYLEIKLFWSLWTFQDNPEVELLANKTFCTVPSDFHCSLTKSLMRLLLEYYVNFTIKKKVKESKNVMFLLYFISHFEYSSVNIHGIWCYAGTAQHTFLNHSFLLQFIPQWALCFHVAL